jgi:hypothetical protein
MAQLGVTGGFKACFTINALAQCLTGTDIGKIALFAISASINEKGLSMDLGNIRGREKEEEDIMNCKGDYYVTNTGATVINDFTFDITIGDDYSYLINTMPGQYKDIFKAIAEGGTFQDGNGETWTVVGTNGTKWIGGDKAVPAQPFGNLFLKDGYLRDPRAKNADGSWKTYTNGKALAYNDTSLVSVELVYDFGNNQFEGKRIPYALNTSNTFNEGSGASINMHQLSFKRLSDVISIEKYTKEGVSFAETIAASTVIKNGVNVDYILQASGTVPSNIVPDISCATGDSCVVVDTDDGVITGYVATGTNTWGTALATLTFEKGAKIYGSILTNATTDSGEYGYIVGSGESTNTKATEITTGEFIIPIYEYEVAETKFKAVE